MLISLLFVIGGIALLYFGGEVLVESAKRIAFYFGMSPMAIGLTVVAFATSAPELAAAMTANLRGAPDLAVGNAIGSNITNVGLILGTTAILYVLPATPRFLRREMAFMVGVTVLMYPVLLTSRVIGRLEGLALFGLLIFFLYTLLRDPGHQHVYAETDVSPAPLWRSSAGVTVGVGLLVGGAYILVDGASDIALALGVPERVIGLTVVALGTSLPELAACLVAGKKGEVDMVMGNIVGSNIFNLLCILGLTAVVAPIPVAAQVVSLDFWVMLGTSALLLGFLVLTRELRRVEGLVLVAIYVAYSLWLFLG